MSKFPDKQTEILYELALDSHADKSTGDSSDWILHLDLFVMEEDDVPGIPAGSYLLYEYDDGRVTSKRQPDEWIARKIFKTVEALYKSRCTRPPKD